MKPGLGEEDDDLMLVDVAEEVGQRHQASREDSGYLWTHISSGCYFAARVFAYRIPQHARTSDQHAATSGIRIMKEG